MKKTSIKYFVGAFLMLFIASSCDDQLDINENPNAATVADVSLVLPAAIVSTASVSNQFNSYGAHFGGYMANAGGFSGFGNLLNYNLTPNDWNGMWVTSYQDPLADLKYVMELTEGDDEMAYFNAAAKIMTVVNYQRLVDAFGDIPYSEALQAEEGNVTPAYDDAATIYRDLFAKLDQAIDLIENAQFPLRLTTATDPLFGEFASGDAKTVHMKAWQKYANTLKLRILLRVQAKPEFAAFVTEGFNNLDLGLGFIENDAIVDPGYELNKPNPEWATWGRTIALGLANSSRIPTTYAYAFYSGTKISDNGRGYTIYVNFPATTPHNQLGNEDGAPTIVTGQVTWASNRAGFEGTGVLKGAGMGQPLMLAAEARFLAAEAQTRGLIAGTVYGDDARLNFKHGIGASFAYLFKDENEVMKDTTGFVAAYFSTNDGNDLVDWDVAVTNDTEIEAIITQKYIALNMINSDEAWNEYRRTGFPATVPGGAAALDIASNKSGATSRPDRLPTRILYPSSEASYNATNFRTINPLSDLIFWDAN